MKKLLTRLSAALLFLCALAPAAQAADSLVPVGQVVGLELLTDTVTVAAFTRDSQARDAGVQVGDILTAINGQPITCPQDIRDALNISHGTVELTLRRSDRDQTLQLSPAITADGPKLGIYLKQGVTGIGTVTYYDPDTGAFGTLGHGVNGPDGTLLPMTGGQTYEAKVISVRKGTCGEPGQLMGALGRETAIGTLERNTAQGVFGKTDSKLGGDAIPIGTADSVKTGPATIRSTVSGTTVREYSVEILKVYSADRKNGRNMLIKITDPALLETTGGIVQGMSGSPIIQDGKLIGAVTHVLVNDPTTGYGIFIENMLDAAA